MDDPNDYSKKSIEELMVYNGFTPIIPELNALGYDVIVVNQPEHSIQENNFQEIDGGADYIERNAMAHIQLYQDLNTTLTANGSIEQLVILGPSMGGQISRYALAYMEKKQDETGLAEWNHNCRLWVSIDSPHQGANIPLGGQANIFFFGYPLGNQEAKDKYDKKLKSYAGRQQIIEQFDRDYNGGPPFYYLPYTSPPSLHTAYYNNLNNNGLAGSNGYPMNLRKIAIANGSIAGNKINNEGEKVLNVVAFKGSVKGFSNEIWNTNTTQNSIFKGFKIEKELDAGWIYVSLSFTKTKMEVINNNTNPKGVLDVLPGGLFNTVGDILGDDDTGIIKELEQQRLDCNISFFHIRDYKENHAFIPTHSTLDTNGFSDWYQPIDENLLCNAQNPQTPFDNYYGEEHNSDHVTFTTKTKDWLFAEIQATNLSEYPTPSVYLTENDLVGADRICYNDTETFTYSICKLPDNVEWSTSINLQINNITDNSITVTSTNANTALHWIDATHNGVLLLRKFIQGKPYITYTITNQIQNRYIIELQGVSFGSTVTWEQTGGDGTLFDGGFGDTIRGATGVNANWTVEGIAHITNNCGSSNMPFVIQGPNDPCSSLSLRKTGVNKYTAKTDPNGDWLEDPCNNLSINNAELYNIYGEKEEDFIPNNDEIEINEPLQPGTVKYIRANVNGEIIYKTIVVE
ncbi:MAG: hypothetical protein V3U80_06645 [Flavobacteriaceae bacterium]